MQVGELAAAASPLFFEFSDPGSCQLPAQGPALGLAIPGAADSKHVITGSAFRSPDTGLYQTTENREDVLGFSPRSAECRCPKSGSARFWALSSARGERFGDTELAYMGLQSGALHAEARRGAIRTGNDPIGLFQRAENL